MAVSEKPFFIKGNLLKNPVALITGANTGIGRHTALKLAKKGFKVFLACRSWDKTQPVLEEINQLEKVKPAEFLELDLADQASIRRCALSFLARQLPLHLLINNAGQAGAKGLTADGFEVAFGVNHLGHFLLTQLLLERLESSAPSRVITVASRAHHFSWGLHWAHLREPTRSFTGIREYANSKLANILFSQHLALILKGSGVSCYALHPGLVATEIWRHVPRFLQPLLKWRGMLSEEEGAQCTLYCALDAPASESGLYYAKSKIHQPSRLAQSEKMALLLWQKSLEWVNESSRFAKNQD